MAAAFEIWGSMGLSSRKPGACPRLCELRQLRRGKRGATNGGLKASVGLFLGNGFDRAVAFAGFAV